MKPLTLSFTTALKISAKATRGRIGELRRFTQPGGYDFYKKMKQIAGDLVRGNIDLAGAKAAAGEITSLTERKHAIEALENLSGFLTGKAVEWREPPLGVYESDSGLLRIKLQPELAWATSDGKTLCLHIWNLARPLMTDGLAGRGVWLLADELGKPDNRLGLLNLRTKKIFSEQVIAPTSGLQFKHDLLTIEEIWKDIHNPSMSVDDTISHISSLSFPAL